MQLLTPLNDLVYTSDLFTMNHPAASVPAASPCTFLFVKQNLPHEDNDPYSSSGATQELSDFHARALGVRESARQRWEELKPLIQRVYIEEDRPYPYLANILRTQHGFETTYDSKFNSYNTCSSDLTNASGNANSRGR